MRGKVNFITLLLVVRTPFRFTCVVSSDIVVFYLTTGKRDILPLVNVKHFLKIRIFCPPEKFKALQSVNFTFDVDKNNNILLCSTDKTAFWA